ncbi:hypothetical protein ACVWY6_003921 [Williamsia sp. R60]
MADLAFMAAVFGSFALCLVVVRVVAARGDR